MRLAILGTVVEADGIHRKLVTIDDGVVVNVGPPDHGIGMYVFDNDMLLFPGFIDIHTHCREDASGKDTHKEDYLSAGLAALSGGVVCVADMPNNPVVPYDAERYLQKRSIAETKCPIDVLLYAAINQDSKPFADNFDSDDSKPSYQNDVPYKVFMGPSTNHSGDLNFDNNDKLDLTLSRYNGKSVSFHCEDPALLNQFAAFPTREARRPSEAEVVAVKLACDLIEKHELRGKICHVSTAGGLDAILDAKKRGVNVVCEVTPHHLYFDVSMITGENRKWLQMNPPIRDRADREYLLQALRDGKIDFLATDHAPHTQTEKLRGVSGVPLLDTYGAFVAWLIKEQKVNPVTIFDMACRRPAEWIAQFRPNYRAGRIKSGYDANVVVLNLQSGSSAVDGRPIYSKCGWSPFDLRSLPGFVSAVWKRGQKIIDGLYIDGSKI